MPRKGVKLETVNFRIIILLLLLLLLQLVYLTNHSTTNMKLGREMKLCDPTNIGMLKSM